MKTNIKISTLISAQQIQERVKELAKQISRDYQNSSLKIVVLLKGSFIFAADLVREIDIPLQIHFMQVSSYGNKKISSGNIQILKDLNADIENDNVLIVEDIVDSGTTLKHILELLKTRSPKSLRIVSLLVKEDTAQLEYPIDYPGFSIGNEFVVGYGLDFAEDFRHLDFIGVIKE